MEINKTIEFINMYFPECSSEIATAMELLASSILGVKTSITKLLPKLYNNNEFEKISECIEHTKDITYIMDMLSNYSDLLLVEIQTEDEVNNEAEKPAPKSQQGKIDYNKFRTDEKMPYNLYYDFTHTKPAAFSIEGNRHEVRRWQDLYIKTCEYLLKKDKTIFATFISDEDMQGKKRIYFSNNTDNLFKPKAIKGSNVYLESNLSANHIRNIIVRMLDKYDISRQQYQVFLSKDLSPLHIDSK